MKRLNAVSGLLGGLAVFGWAAVLGLPWIELQPNRIASGDPVFLGRSHPVWAAAVLALWLLPAVLALKPGWQRAARRAAWCVCVFLPVALLFAAGVSGTQNGAARIALSWGFWCTVLVGASGSVLLSGAWSRAARRIASLSAALLIGAGLASGVFSPLSLLREYAAQAGTFWTEVGNHLALSGLAVAAGSLAGLLAGYGASRLPPLRKGLFFFLNVVQTLPSLAVFGLLIAPLAALGVGGVGPTPAVLVLSVYAAFPVARAAVTAIDQLDPAVLDVGRGLGMAKGQLLFQVQIPLALPVVIQGLRTASVQTIGNTVVAALIGAGGLGSLIFIGLGQFAPDLILLGTLPALALALAADQLWAGIASLVSWRTS